CGEGRALEQGAARNNGGRHTGGGFIAAAHERLLNMAARQPDARESIEYQSNSTSNRGRRFQRGPRDNPTISTQSGNPARRPGNGPAGFPSVNRILARPPVYLPA